MEIPLCRNLFSLGGGRGVGGLIHWLLTNVDVNVFGSSVRGVGVAVISRAQ